MGATARSSTSTNKASSTRPATPVASTAAAPQPEVAPVDSANMNNGKPVPASRNPGRSNGPGGCSEPRGRNSAPKTSAGNPTGRLRGKIQRQESPSTSRPPITGPSAGATSVGTISSRFALIRSAGGYARNIIAIPTGISSPPPAPCTARNTTSSGSDVATPHSADAAVNSPMAASTTLRAPNRSPTQPDTGITTASVTRYAVTTPLTDATGTAKYLLSVGSATLTTVASMMLRNMDATNTAPTTSFGDRRAFTDYYKAGPAGPVPCRSADYLRCPGPSFPSRHWVMARQIRPMRIMKPMSVSH